MLDAVIKSYISDEQERQSSCINLIASENYVSADVMQAQGSVATNKYAEGYIGARYYGGCSIIDEIEGVAIQRACKLFDARFANVQPHSGSQANQAVFFAFLKPGDSFLSMSLRSGGHLTHGAPVSMSGSWFNPCHYNVDESSGLIDYDSVRSLALKTRPKLIIAGGSTYSRNIDFHVFRKIADEVGACLLVDMAHFAGIVAAGLCDNPVNHAHVVTSTTHKTLRGPRGGFILCNDQAIAKKIDKAVFPGIQGGPQMHSIAAKAVAFFEALQPAFIDYMKNVLDNARTFANTLANNGLRIISGGTDTHLFLVDVSSLDITGKHAEYLMEGNNIICNRNTIPFDKLPANLASGIRIGTPCITTRGFDKEHVQILADAIVRILSKGSSENTLIAELCNRFPL